MDNQAFWDSFLENNLSLCDKNDFLLNLLGINRKDIEDAFDKNDCDYYSYCKFSVQIMPKRNAIGIYFGFTERKDIEKLINNKFFLKTVNSNLEFDHYGYKGIYLDICSKIYFFKLPEGVDWQTLFKKHKEAKQNTKQAKIKAQKLQTKKERAEIEALKLEMQHILSELQQLDPYSIAQYKPNQNTDLQSLRNESKSLQLYLEETRYLDAEKKQILADLKNIDPTLHYTNNENISLKNQISDLMQIVYNKNSNYFVSKFNLEVDEVFLGIKLESKTATAIINKESDFDLRFKAICYVLQKNISDYFAHFGITFKNEGIREV